MKNFSEERSPKAGLLATGRVSFGRLKLSGVISTVSGILLAVGASAAFASSYLVARMMFGEHDEQCDPVWISFLRFGTAAAFFLLTAAVLGRLKAMWKMFLAHWRELIVLALLGVVGEGFLLFLSSRYTTAARSSLFANLSPVFTIIAAALIIREKITILKVVSLVLGFAGACYLACWDHGADIYTGQGKWTGDLLALGSAVCWSVYTVLGRKYSAQDALCSVGLTLLIGSGIFLLLVFATGSDIAFRMPSRLWYGTIYLGLIPSAVAYYLWIAASRRLEAGTLGFFGYVSLALTALGSAMLLRERFTIHTLLAVLVIISGSLLLMFQKKRST